MRNQPSYKHPGGFDVMPFLTAAKVKPEIRKKADKDNDNSNKDRSDERHTIFELQ